MANVIELIARLKDEASGALEKLGVNLRKVADVGLEPIARISPTAASALGGLLDKAGPTGLAVAAIGGAAIGAVVGITHLVKGVADVGDRLHDMETRTGASVEALQALGHAASKSGGSLEDVVQSFRFLQQAITQAGEGNDQAIRGFEKLGLNLAELQQLSPEAQFATLAKAINDISDPAARATAAVDVFGRAGASLLPTLKEVAERGLDQIVESAKRLGIVLSSETAAKADEFNDTLADIGAVARGLVLSLGAELLPTFVELAKGIAEAAQGLTTFLRETNAVAITVGAIKLAIAPVAEAMNVLVTAGLAAAKVLSGDFSGAAAVLAAGASNMGEAFSGAFAGITKGSAEASEALKKSGDAAKQAADQTTKLSEKQVQVIASVADAAKKAAQDRESAEIAASGNVLAQISRDLDQQKAAIEAAKAKQLEAIEQVASTGIDKAALRAQAERTQLDAIVAAEIDAATKRKAAIAGFVTEALGFIKSLGPGLEEVQKKLEIADALNKAAQALQALGQSAGAANLTSKDLADTVSKVRDQLTALGATGAQIGATVPENIRAIADGFVAVANKAVLVNGVFTNVVSGLEQVEAAAERLDNQLTGQSLDDSFVEVAAAAGNFDEDLQEMPFTIGSVADAVQLAGGDIESLRQFIIAATSTMDPLEASFTLAASGLLTFGETANVASDAIQEVSDAGSEGPSRFAKFADSLKQAAIGAQGLASASHAAGGAMAEMGNIGAGVAAIIAAMNPFFSGRTTDEILAQRVKFVKDLSQVLAEAQGHVETLKGSMTGAGGAGFSTRSLAEPLFEGAARLEQAGQHVAEDIFAGARAFAAARPFGGAPSQFFQGGGVVQGPPGRHIPILAEPGELVLPRDVTERIQRLNRRGGRTFQQGGVVAAASGAGQGMTIINNISINGLVDSDRRLDALARDLGERIKDKIRRGIMLP